MRHNRLPTMLLVFLIGPAAALTGFCMIPAPGSGYEMPKYRSMGDIIDEIEAKVDQETFQIRPAIGMRIIAATDDLFTADHTTLQADARSDLTIIANALMTRPDGIITIAAYTDDQGNKAANEALSRQQAEIIAETFQDAAQSAGAHENYQSGRFIRLRTAPNPSADDRARNRRVEIYYNLPTY